jgi:AcrR family transcriptional regulator
MQPQRSVQELFGQPPPARNGRERLISAGLGLFCRLGFQAVGIDKVISQAGVTKTTFYKHFQGKDDFVLACVISRDAWESQAWENAARMIGGHDAQARLLAVFDLLHEWFATDGFRGCIFVNAAMEFADRRDPVHQAAAKHKRARWEYVRREARALELADPDRFADEYVLLFEGALAMRHVYGRDDAAIVARRVVERVLRASRQHTLGQSI